MDYFVYLRAVRESSLTTKARIVALIIASYNPSFPTNKQIAAGTGLSERTVRTAKKELVEAGFLIQRRNYDAANSYTPTAPVAVPYGTDCRLNTNINTNLNTNNKSDSEESSLVNFNLISTKEVEDLLSW